MTVYDLLASWWRTAVPAIVGVLVVAAARLNIEIDGAAAASALTAAAGTLYYGLIRTAEQRLSPSWGWLLGLARPPHYARPGPDDRELRQLGLRDGR